MLSGTYPIHFVDNQGALSALVKGSSSDVPASWIAHDVAARLFGMRSRVWFEYIESAANIADLPSRCDSKLAARMLQRRFGRAVKPRRMLLPPLRACRGQGF